MGKISIKPTSGSFELDINEKDQEFLTKISENDLFGILGDNIAFWRYKNGLKVLKKARMLSEEHNVPLNLLPSKFVVSLMNEASLEEDDDLQTLWAKLLVGEGEKPGKYSLKTIEVLKVMRPADAKLFSKYLSFALYTKDSGFLAYFEEINEKYSISYNEMIKLSELGLFNNDKGIKITLDKSESTHYHSNIHLFLFQNKVTTLVENHLNISLLTTAGYEISLLCTQGEDNLDYLIDLGIAFKKKFPKLLTSLHKVIDKCDYDEFDLLASTRTSEGEKSDG